MKEYTIYLYQDEIDSMVGLLDKGDFDAPSIEDILLRGILTQIFLQEHRIPSRVFETKPVRKQDGR